SGHRPTACRKTTAGPSGDPADFGGAAPANPWYARGRLDSRCTHDATASQPGFGGFGANSDCGFEPVRTGVHPAASQRSLAGATDSAQLLHPESASGWRPKFLSVRSVPGRERSEERRVGTDTRYLSSAMR